jgi:hypothetical protein
MDTISMRFRAPKWLCGESPGHPGFHDYHGHFIILISVTAVELEPQNVLNTDPGMLAVYLDLRH